VLANSNLDKGEAYKLTVTPENITISAGSSAGIFYGIQSLKTCIPAKAWASENLTITVPAMQVSDSPRFPHRAVMLDVGRNFRPKQEVLKVLDLMALYKLNVLHFHLTEDEGWRIEIPSLPELTSVGGRRGHTLTETDMLVPSYGSGADASNTNGSGYYTKAEFINILKYAKARHIRVIPEIETPGHARAAIRAMDARYQKYMREGRQKEAEEFLLHDLKDRSVYRSVQGWNDNVINVALPSVYRFMEKVTDEILEMYNIAGAPIQTIHFGGDEVPPGVWTASPAVDSLKKQDPSVKNTDDLWRYYFSKINTMVSARNLYLSGWEEIGLTKTELNGKRQFIPEKAFAGNNFHTDVWNNIFGAEGLAYELANAGYKVLLTMVTNFYFDLAANKSYYEPGQYWGGYVDVDKPFYFIPYDYYKNQKEDTRGNPINKAVFEGKARLTNGGRANITGLQAPVWSEIIKSDELLEYMLLPKLFGLAERAWAKDPAWATEIDSSKSAQQYNRAWSEFINVLGKKELPRLDHYSGGYNYRIPTPGIAMENGKLSAKILYPGMVIRYTTDGSEPGKDSQLYSIPLPANGRVKLKAFNSAGRGGRSVQYVAD
jgi:hexosaminidase